MHHLNWNSIYTFWLVARSGSFAEAARRLPTTTVQALHKRVRQLERANGIDLKLLRSRGVKGVELTEAGRRLIDLIDPVFASLDLMVADLRQEDTGPLSLATTGFAAYNYLPRVLDDFHRAFPGVSVSVRVRSESDVVSLVEGGHVDLAIGAVSGGQREITVTSRAPLSLQLVAPATFRWRNTPVTWAEVVRHPLVLHERVSVLRRALEDLLNRRSLLAKLRIAAEVTTPELAIEMVRARYGVGLIPVGPRLVESLRDLSAIDPPPGLPQIDIAVFHKRNRYLPNYMKSFLEVAAKSIREGAVA